MEAPQRRLSIKSSFHAGIGGKFAADFVGGHEERGREAVRLVLDSFGSGALRLVHDKVA